MLFLPTAHCFHISDCDPTRQASHYYTMKKKLSFIVSIEQITWEGIDLPVSLGQEWFARWLQEAPDLEFSLGKPLTGVVHLEKHDDAILLRGNLQGELIYTCSRCLDVFAEPLNLAFEIFLKGSQTAVPDEERELTGEELNEDYISGEELDLDIYLREQILLALPLKPLCRPECAGLCWRCGANLNRESCSCRSSGFNPAFAGLEKLKQD